MNFIEKMFTVNFCLYYYASGQKLGGGATGDDKRVDDLNSKINIKISVQLRIFSHLVKFIHQYQFI
jgi:hypothetical protein